MLRLNKEFVFACQSIKEKAVNQSKVEVNPLFSRIQIITNELVANHHALSTNNIDLHKEKYHWGVLFRAGDTLDEMNILLKNTTPVPIQDEVGFIKESLVIDTDMVVQKYGKREALFIIPPKFQELSGLW